MLPPHVYLHVPFCRRRCSYCDFAIAVRRDVPWREYADLLDREIALRFPDHGGGAVDTLYLGGGTPSLLGADGVTYVLDRLRGRFDLAENAEVTLEANPDDVRPAAVRSWVHAGVNRVSIGIQSFDDGALAWMHRTHDAACAARAVDAVRAGGITNVSLDLIFALPDGVSRDWARDLDRLIALDPVHASVYGLTVEPRTPLGRWTARGTVAETDEDRYAEEFLAAHRALTSAGFEHYEVSSYAKPGCRSRHNASYWRHVPYAGFGPAAHSFDGRSRRWNHPAYTEWARAVGEGRDPCADREVLSEEARHTEHVYLSLRTSGGLVVESPPVGERIQPWIQAGWAVADGDRVTLTPAGWLRLDTLAADLTVATSHYQL